MMLWKMDFLCDIVVKVQQTWKSEMERDIICHNRREF